MDESVGSMPTYRISRDRHGIPQFSPKRGSQALKDALIYAFPTLDNELQLMQAALKKFFDSERGIQIICELPENDLQHSLIKKRDIEISPLQEQKAGLRNWKASGIRPTSRLNSRTTSRAPSRTGSRAGSRAGSRPSSRASSCARESSVDLNGGGLMTTWSLESGRELDRLKKRPYDPVKRRKVAENRGNACDKHRAAKSACDPTTCPQNKLFGRASEKTQTVPKDSRQHVLVHQASAQKLDGLLSELEFIPTPDTMLNIHEDFSTVPTDCDVFWDAPDQMNTSTTLLSFGCSMSTSSFAGSWADSSYNDLSAWSPNSSCFAVPEATTDIPFQEALPVETTSGLRRMISQADLCDASVPLPQISTIQNNTLSSHREPSNDTSDVNTLPTPVLQPEQVLASVEDPFMGWASRKANHIFDDYGWVLSHVETL